MVLAVPGVPTLADVRLALIACLGIWLVAGAAAAFNCLVEKGIDAKMRRTAWRATAKGELSDWQTLLFAAVLCALGSLAAVCVGQPADHVADLRHLRRLRGDLHRHPQAADAAEHRDRRRLGRDAAGAGLGRDDGRRRARGADPLPHHLPVDAAAFLGAGAVPRRGLSQVGPADAAGDAWQRVHPPADLPVHAGAVRGLPDALRLRHELLAVPGGRAGAELRFLAAMASGSGASIPTRWRARPSAFR